MYFRALDETDDRDSFVLSDIMDLDVRPYTQIAHFESGEEIMREDSAPEYLYFLYSGRAKLFLTNENGLLRLSESMV